MLFTSLTYFLFFWLVFAGYWGLRRRNSQNALLLFASYVFYGWWDYRFLSLLVISTLIDFFGALGIEKADSSRRRKVLLTMCVGANLGILFVFKYYDFFLESLYQGLAFSGADLSGSGLGLVLPLGISFYTFQTISYTVDVYRGKVRACRWLVDYAAYVSFFPQLVAGPIERGSRLIPQFQNNRQFSLAESKEGLRLALWGVFKKLVIADNLARFVDPIYAAPEMASGMALAIATVAFAFQIYCDFSGYSDIAIGSAKLLGFNLMRNFAFPYFSQDLGEFWRRWHISLSTWFRDYVYVPLGGGKLGIKFWIRNALITFGLSGLWHGAAVNFLIWGLLNGFGYVLFASERKRSPRETPLGPRLIPGVGALVRAVFVFVFICVTWVFFRAETFHDAMTIFYRMATLSTSANGGAAMEATFGMAFSYILPLASIELLTRRHEQPFAAMNSWPMVLRWGAYFATAVSVLYFMPETQSVFVYFQF